MTPLRDAVHLQRQVQRHQEEARLSRDPRRREELAVLIRFYERQLRAALWRPHFVRRYP